MSRSTRFAPAFALCLALFPTSTIANPPDISGPGKVLTAGRVYMKVTNFGFVGNAFMNLSSDPAGQWPGLSGVEYLNTIRLAVGAVDPTAPDTLARRVSYLFDWRPTTAAPEDKIYQSHEHAPNGERFVNDDRDFDPSTGEPRIDEDFLDGRDNDGDGLIDEDYAAVGDQMYSCVMHDDTQEAIAAGQVPLVLDCQQLAWAYSSPGYMDFNVVEYTIINRSGHMLDSLTIGWLVDMDVGPLHSPTYFTDDLDLPGYPQGEFVLVVRDSDPRRQFPHAPSLDAFVPPDSALCPRMRIRVNGFSTCDDNNDGGATQGIASFLLLDHTTDPRGLEAPSRVGFRAFRSYTAGTPFDQGGHPSNDAQRFQFMTSTENIDPATGLITASPHAQIGDYVQWCSVGPFRHVPNGGRVSATIAFAVQTGNHALGLQYAGDYALYKAGLMNAAAFFNKYPSLSNAFRAQLAFEGSYAALAGEPVPDFHGRETGRRLAKGEPPVFDTDCREELPRAITDQYTTWFDYDCDYCTGVWDYPTQQGLFHRTWIVPAALLVDVEPQRASRLEMGIPAPNPTRAGARLSLSLPATSEVKVVVVDVAGRLVREIADGSLPAGSHGLVWDGRDAAGTPVPAGLYFIRVRAGGRAFSAKLAVLR